MSAGAGSAPWCGGAGPEEGGTPEAFGVRPLPIAAGQPRPPEHETGDEACNFADAVNLSDDSTTDGSDKPPVAPAAPAPATPRKLNFQQPRWDLHSLVTASAASIATAVPAAKPSEVPETPQREATPPQVSPARSLADAVAAQASPARSGGVQRQASSPAGLGGGPPPGAAATAAARAAAAAVHAATVVGGESGVPAAAPGAMPETVKALGEAAWALVDAVPAGPMQDAALAVAHAALAVVDAAKGRRPGAAGEEEPALAPLELEELGEASTPSFTAAPPKSRTSAGAVPPAPDTTPPPSARTRPGIVASGGSPSLRRSSSLADCQGAGTRRRASGRTGQAAAAAPAQSSGRDSWALGVDSNEHYRRICSIASVSRTPDVPLTARRVGLEGSSRPASGSRCSRAESFGALPSRPSPAASALRWAAPPAASVSEGAGWSRLRSPAAEPPPAARSPWQSPAPAPPASTRGGSSVRSGAGSRAAPGQRSPGRPQGAQEVAWGAGSDRPGAALRPGAGQQPRGGVFRQSSAPGTAMASRGAEAEPSELRRPCLATSGDQGGEDGRRTGVGRSRGGATSSSPDRGAGARSSSLPRSPGGCWEAQAGESQGGGRGPSTHEVRETLNRSEALAERGVYKSAAERQTWEVSRLHIKNLPGEATDESLRRMCRAFGHQVVEARTERDVVKDRCRGEAQVLLRYCPTSASTTELVSFLETRAGCNVQQQR